MELDGFLYRHFALWSETGQNREKMASTYHILHYGLKLNSIKQKRLRSIALYAMV